MEGTGWLHASPSCFMERHGAPDSSHQPLSAVVLGDLKVDAETGLGKGGGLSKS